MFFNLSLHDIADVTPEEAVGAPSKPGEDAGEASGCFYVGDRSIAVPTMNNTWRNHEKCFMRNVVVVAAERCEVGSR